MFWLDLRPVLQEEMHTWYCESDQELMVGEFTEPGSKPLLLSC